MSVSKLCASIALLFAFSLGAQAATTVQVVIPVRTVIGSNVTVLVNYNSTTDFFGFSGDVTYNSSILTPDSIVLQGDAATLSCGSSCFSSGNSSVAGSITGMYGAFTGNLTGSNTLLAITFKTKQTGAATITLSNLQFYDDNLGTVAIDTSTSTLTGTTTVVLPTTTSISASLATVTYPAAQTFTAGVTANSVAVTGGTVSFVDTVGNTIIAANVPVNGSGQASLTTSLNAGSHSIQATFNGTTDYATSSSGNSNVTVNKASLTVTADAKTVAYGTAPTYTVTVSGFLNGDASTVVSGAAGFATTATVTNGKPNAGSWVITPAVGTLTATNYAFTTFVPGALTVNKAALTVTADAKTITYGNAATFSATITGLINNDTSAVVGGAPAFSTNATTTNGVPNAGAWTITPTAGTLTAQNYTFSTFTTGTLTVNKATLTVTADAKTITYPAPAPTLTATITGFVNGETSTVVTGTPALASNATTTNGNPNAGSFTITPSTGTLSATNYSFSLVVGTLTVNKASLTVKADNKTATYGTTPTYTTTITGLVNADTSAVVTGAASFTTNAGVTNGNPNAGSWTITPATGTLTAANYSFTFTTGSLTVSKVPLTVTADAKTTIYGTAPPYSATLTGFVNGDTSGAATGAASYTTNATLTNGNINVGSWTITPAAGTLAATNYTFTTFNTGTLTVSKATLSVSLAPTTITYGAAFPPFAYSGFANGDSASVLTGTPSFTSNATLTNGKPNPGSWTVTPAAGTLASSNYSFNLVAITLTVNKAVLTVTANSTTMVIRTTVPNLSASITGFVNGDTSAVVTGSPTLTTTATATSDLADYPITVGIGTLTAANYSFTLVNGILAVLSPSNPVPVISGISPQEITAGSPNTKVTVSGSNFLPTSTVGGGPAGLPTTFISSAELSVTLPASSLASGGTYNLIVTNPEPGGGPSLSVQLRVRNPAPVIKSAEPVFLIAATAATNLTLRGSGFVPASVFRLNGSTRTVNFVSVSQVTLALSASDIAAPGLLSIAVTNSAPGGGEASLKIPVMPQTSTTPVTVGQGTTTLPFTPNADNTQPMVSGFAGFHLGSLIGLSTLPDKNGVLTEASAATAADATLPAVFARWTLVRNGVTISEANVPAVVPFNSGRAFATVSSTVNTAIAIANPNAETAIIDFFYTDASGQNVGRGTLNLDAGSQTSRFLSESPFNAAPGLEGTFTFSSTLPVAVAILRTTQNSRGDFLMTPLPVSDLALPTLTGLETVPHFTDGEGWSTDLLLVNPSDSALNGTVQFFDRSGQPVLVSINGTTAEKFDYSIPPKSERRLSTSGLRSGLATGSIRIAPGVFDNKVPSAAAVVKLQSGGSVISEAGVFGTTSRSLIQGFVESGPAESGIAIANTSAAPITVSLDLGTAHTTVTLPGNGQYSSFLKQIPGFENLTSPLQGVLKISGPPTLAAAILRLRSNERGDVLMTASPLLPDPAPSADAEVIVPQIVNGGGYTTSFFLVNSSSSQVSLVVRLVDASGQPIKVK